MSMQIGSQNVKLDVKVQGNTQLVTFQVQIISYREQQFNEPQTITVKIVCPTAKIIRQVVNGQLQIKTVKITPEECVQNWLKVHEKIYKWR